MRDSQRDEFVKYATDAISGLEKLKDVSGKDLVRLPQDLKKFTTSYIDSIIIGLGSGEIVDYKNLVDKLSSLKKYAITKEKSAKYGLWREKIDRCVRIAKRKYKKWPSAYASGAVVRCRAGKIWKGVSEDFSKEKEQGLHGWFARRGGKGGKGWVDCNTCRKDPKTGQKKCKSCGRQSGEKRAKYPACRPTPSQCNVVGVKNKKGPRTASWRKKNESIFQNNFIFENTDLAQSDVNKIIKYSEQLQNMFTVNDQLEDWVKAKLNHACDYVATARDYLKFYQDEKNSIDELYNETVELNKKYKDVDKIIDALQYALDVVGLEPTIGSIADASNSVISLLRAALSKETDESKKHLLNAAISAVSVIPFGDLAKLIKLRVLRKPAVKLLKFVKNYLKSTNPSYEDELLEKWSNSYKKSINCNNPRGFSQKAHCRARKLRQSGQSTSSKPVREIYKEVVSQLLEEYNSSMALGTLKQINSDAKELVGILQSNDQLEDWVKAKLNLAGEYLDDVYHHLDYFGSNQTTNDYDVIISKKLNEGWKDWVAAGTIGLSSLSGGSALAAKPVVKPAVTQQSTTPQSAVKSSESSLLDKKTSEYIGQWEGKRNTVYLDTEKKPTIGIGHYLTNTQQDRDLFKALFGDAVNYDNILNGKQKLSDEQIEKLFNVDVKVKERLASSKISNFSSFPQYVKNAIINAFYRGDIGPKTIKLMNAGKWDSVSREYLDHQNARSGPEQIKRRMKTNALAFDQYAKNKNEYFGFNYAIG